MPLFPHLSPQTELKSPFVRNVTVLVIVISAGDSHRIHAHLLLIILENRL